MSKDDGIIDLAARRKRKAVDDENPEGLRPGARLKWQPDRGCHAVVLDVGDDRESIGMTGDQALELAAELIFMAQVAVCPECKKSTDPDFDLCPAHRSES